MKKIKKLIILIILITSVTTKGICQSPNINFNGDTVMQSAFRDTLSSFLTRNLRAKNIGDTNYKIIFSVRFKINNKNIMHDFETSILTPDILKYDIEKSIEQSIEATFKNHVPIPEDVLNHYLLIPIYIFNSKSSKDIAANVKDEQLFNLFSFAKDYFGTNKHYREYKQFEGIILNTIGLKFPPNYEWNAKFQKYYKIKSN